MKTPQTVKTFLFSLLFLAAQYARADIRGPYTPDANTLFLLHFDEVSGSSAATNSGSKGGNFYTVLNDTAGNGLANPPTGTSLLGHSSFPGFGNAVTATNTDGTPSGVIGYDGNNSGAYEADVQGGPASPDAIALTNLNMGNGGVTPFTLEALICPTVINANQEIISTDDYNGQRGFQFKITSDGKLQFQMINGNTVNVTFPIPTSGPNAFVPGTWYHVALSYDGVTARLYWTKLDAANGAANLLGSSGWTCTTNTGAIVAPLDIGAENRGSAGESFRGLIDEVRISSVARAADEMQFFSSAVTISQQPVSQNVDDYQPVTFRVTAGSIFQIGYQWRFDGSPIPDATNASYSIASVNLTNAGNYDVVITNTAGNSATSEPATLTVGAANFLAHRWSFASDTSDSIGGATGTNHGTAVVSGGALVLDGTADGYMELPPHLLSGLSAVTFDFWATFGANGDNCRVFDFGNTNFVNPSVPPPQNYVFFSPRAGGGTHVIGISGGSSEFQQTLAGLGTLDGQTVHVTCVIDPPNNVMSIYTNGVLETSASLSVSLASLNDELCWIGRSLFDADPYLNASIDEFRIYGGALSASSVQQSDAAGPDNLLSDGPVQLAIEPVNTVAAINQSATFTGSALGHLPITFQWFENGEAISGATNNSYTLIATSDKNNHTFQLRATNVVAGITYSAVSSNATLTVRVPLNLTWAGVGPDWDTASLNWTTDNNTSQTHYTESDSAIFDNLGAGQPNVNLTQELHPSSVTVNSSSTYNFGGIGSIAGPASLIKNGSGTLVIDTTNTYTGPTIISGGTLQVGDGTISGALGAGPITNNAALVLQPAATDVIALPMEISGTGNLTLSGAANGATILSGTNNYGGGTTVSSGSLHPRSSSALGTGNTVVNAGGQIYADVNVDLDSHPLTLNGSGISNDGAFRKGGAGVTTFGGTITLGSDTMINVDGGAVLNLTNALGINGSSVNANLTLTGSGAGNITGPVSLGLGNLTVSGGTWTVGPTNSYSGLTTISAGALL
ncbi:MAG TPA: LamG-like jellyroll fold domain-containing protein, partial [Verrucomicrobiae bacterium]|nr:LamG-like jellyroll fold domain-containing protein [Verrucomicrobiae bacterium]